MEQPLDILLPRHTLEEALGTELAKQYRLRRGEDCRFMPVSDGCRYLCTCGCANSLGEACGECGRMPEFLDREALDALREEARQRLVVEDAERARQEAQRQAEEARQKKLRRKKKLLRITGITATCIAVAMVAVLSFWGITRVAIPSFHYERALQALEKEDYKEAHRQFMLANHYGDTQEYLDRFYTPCVKVRSTSGFSGGLMKYEYDEYGRLILTSEVPLKIDANGKILENGAPTEYVRRYDERGNALEEQDWNGRTVCSYNEHGDVVQEVRYQTDGEEGHSKTYCYVYDELGRIIQEDEICSNFISLSYSYEQMTQYTYDEKGRVAKTFNQTNYPASAESSYETESVWVYDDEDRPISLVESTVSPFNDMSDSVKKTEWRYDEQGRELECVTITEYPQDPLRNISQTTRYAYNSEGRMTDRTLQNLFLNEPTRNATIRQKWVYDWENRLVEEWDYMGFVDEEYQRYSGYDHTVTYRYDLLGRVVEKESVWEYTDSQRNTRNIMTYEYGPDGMVEKANEVNYAEGESSECTIYYNDNGLEERVVFPLDNGETVSEYSYTYFYYPEGTEKPQNTVSQMLYG